MNMHLQPYSSFVECRVNVDVCFYSTCAFLTVLHLQYLCFVVLLCGC